MIRLCSIFLFICLGLSHQVIAETRCSTPVFGVSAITINESSDTANLAQQIAMREAHDTAFTQMLDRLLLSPLPAAEALVPEDFAELVHIRTETSLPGRYIAEIDICFSPQEVRRFFTSQQAVWAEVRTPPILVLPIYETPAGIRAWRDDVSWIAGWRDIATTHQGLVQFTSLPRTLVNERQLRAESLASAAPDILAKAIDIAGAVQVLVLHATQSFQEDREQFIVRATLYNEEGQAIASLDDFVVSGVTGQTEAQLDAVKSDIISEFEMSWKEANQRTGTDDNTLIVEMPYDDLATWLQRRTALQSMPIIASFKVLTQTNRSAILAIEMAGSIESLRYSLSSLNLRLENNDDAYSIIGQEE